MVVLALTCSIKTINNEKLVLHIRNTVNRYNVDHLIRYEEALADVNKSLEIKPNDSWALSSRGNVYRKMNKYEEALADFNKSLEIKPNDSWTLSRQGEVYRMMNKYEEALADLNKSLEINPNDSW